MSTAPFTTDPSHWAARPRYQPLVPAAVAVAAGMVCDRWVPIPFGWCWFAGLAAMAVWWVAWKTGRLKLACPLLFVTIAASGAAWHHAGWYLFAPDDIGLRAFEFPQPVALEAIALERPRSIPAPAFDPLRAIPAKARSRFKLQVTALRDGAVWKPASGRTRIDVDGPMTGVRHGDRIRVFAQMTAPRPPASAGQYDYAGDRRAFRMLALLRTDTSACVTVIQPAGWFNPAGWIDDLRMEGDRLLWRNLHRDRSGLAAALLLGIRDELDSERTETFLETGTVHILSISGLHVGILAAALFMGLRCGLVPRRIALAAVSGIVTLYAVLTDAEAPVVRAAILVVAVCVSLAVYRRALAFNLLAAAALIVLALNPADLFRIGPQLSFLSVAALSFSASWLAREKEEDPLDRLIARTRPWPVRAAKWLGIWAWKLTAASLVVWLVTLPLVMTHFHLISPVAVPLNIVLWLPVALALGSGFTVLLLGWIPIVGPLAGWVCDQSLAMLDYVVDKSAALPLSHFWVSGPPVWWLAGFYGALAAWACGGRAWVPRRWSLAMLLVWLAAGLWGPELLHPKHDKLECAFLPVGHGAAVVVELPGGQTLLYDAGQLGSPLAGARTVAAHLWSRGITHIDAVVISHADVDHFNAIPELLRRFSVGVIYLSPTFLEDQGGAVRALLAAVKDSGVKLQEISAGDALRVPGDCRLEVRHPPPLGVPGSDNANSVVLTLEHRGRRILLTGDLEQRGLEALLSDEPYDCDVLLAPHHGSRFSDPPGLAAWSQPEWVAVSCGHGDDPEAVEEAYGRRGATVLSTVRDGTIEVTIDSDGMKVRGWRK